MKQLVQLLAFALGAGSFHQLAKRPAVGALCAVIVQGAVRGACKRPVKFPPNHSP
jgi:hypothetical protein